jgi:hypothetical protein
MIMPVVERELRVLSRRWTTHALRAGIAAAMMLATMMMFPAANSPSAAASGATLFKVLSWALLVLCGFCGVFLTADQLCQEKREGTLGLLFLANLRGIDVIAGKVAGIGIGALYGLVASLPVMALTLLLGGVTFGEFARVSLALVNILFGSLVCGVWFSTRFIHSRHAAGPTALMMTLLLLGAPMLALAVKVPWPFVAFSPGSAFVMARQGGWFWLVLAISHLLAWGVLWMGGRELERHWRDEEKPDSSPPSFMPSQAPPTLTPTEDPLTTCQAARPEQPASLPVSSSRAGFGKTEWLETDPVLWLIGNPRSYQGPGWIVLALGFLASVLIAASADEGIVFYVVWLLVTVVYLLFSQFMAITQSTRSLSVMRQSRMMELLICTPQGNRIVPAHLKMLRIVHGWPIAVLVAAGTISTLFLALHFLEAMRFMPMILLLGMGLGFAIPAVSCLGIWLALTLRKPQNARIIVLVTLVLPQIVCCSGGVLIAMILPVVFFIFWGLLKSDIRTLVHQND